MVNELGNLCIYCKEDTSFGSGKFVNRIPAYDDENSGYACPECTQMECDRCDDMIGLDEDYMVDGFILHRQCMTEEEVDIYEKEERKQDKMIRKALAKKGR